MINEENKEERIEQYLEGELTGEPLEEFKEKMATDAAFRREVALQRKIVRNVQTVGREQLRTQLKTIHQEMLTIPGAEGGKVVSMPQRQVSYYAIAAVITVVIAAGVILVLVYRTPDEPTLAFLPVEAIDSAGPSRGPSDMLNVMIYPPGDSLDFHYHFADTLKLYGPFDAEEIKLYFNQDTEQYLLESHQKRYLLRKNPTVMRLEEE